MAENTNSEGMLDKHYVFCKEYLIDLNAYKAAIRANYSPKAADRVGPRLLLIPKIAKYIKKAMDERAKRLEINADRVLQELACIGFSDITNYTKWDDGKITVINSQELSQDATRCVAEVNKVGRVVKVKLHDKVAALDKIARHLGMFNDKLNIGGQPGNPIGVEGKIEIIQIKPKQE